MMQKYQKYKKRCFTTFDYNKFTNNILDAKVKKNKLVNKSDISGFIKNSDLDDKTKTLVT